MLKISSKIEKLRKKNSKKERVQFLSWILNPFLANVSNTHFKSYFLNLQQKLLFTSTITKIRSICLLTGRSRSVYRTFRISRLKLRTYANAGYFTGLSKASW
jgi:ribosomal protein S14